jgi:hypothetical protein
MLATGQYLIPLESNMKAALGIRAWLEHVHINGIRVDCSPSGDNIRANGEVPSLTLTLTARNVTWMSVHARSQVMGAYRY